MAFQTAIVFFLLFESNLLHLTNPQNNFTVSCCDENDPLAHDNNCTSLERMLDELNDQLPANFVLELTNGNCTLTKPVNFTQLTNITIKGQGSNHTHIFCNHLEAGLVFFNSSGILLQNFTVDSCGVPTDEGNEITGNASKSVIINNCTNVELKGLVIANSHGYGLLVNNSFGTVLLDQCVFKNNMLTGPDLEYTHGGGGILIIFMPDYGKEKSNYTIVNCIIKQNSVNVNLQEKNIFYPHIAEKGGGLRLLFFHNSADFHITIEDCCFFNNSGTYGGGLYVRFSDSSSNCHLTVSNTKFIANQAKLYGGGGADVGYTTSEYWKQTDYPTSNSALFKSVLFKDNVGYIGGGASIYTASVAVIEPKKRNAVTFDSCNFTSNYATGGAAMDVRPDVVEQLGTLIITNVSFTNCIFSGNSPMDTDEVTQSAVFLTSQVPITFSNVTTFCDNLATALYAASALLTFEEYSTAIFTNNSGEKGGAILLAGESRISLKNNTHFWFINNTASSYGGAICALPTQVHGFIFTDICFLLPANPSGKMENTSFHFAGNRASTKIGDNIFASSLAPCRGLCQYSVKRNLTTSAVFSSGCIGNFSFTEGIKNGSVATFPVNLDCSPATLHPVPGFPLILNISQTDEIGNDVDSLYLLTAKLDNVTSAVSLEHVTVVNHSITFRGKPGETGSLVLENSASVSRRKVSRNFTLTQCPPGYTLQGCNVCACSVFRDEHHYFGISSCRSNASLITLGYWAGYLGVDVSEDTLFTGTCVVEFCNYNHKPTVYGHHEISNTIRSEQELEKTVCGSHRKGILCGTCVDNFSMLYHSPEFTCHKTSTSGCSYGILIYIASELLPVTGLFLTILLFNISLTSGALYSFVFYAQVLEALFVDAFKTVEIKSHVISSTLEILHLVYGTFNLNMLNKESLSFCLIENATAMNLFMFRYGTTLYAVLLVLFTVLILRLHSCYRCVKLCRRCGRRNIRGSIVDGLSAFLVLCYFQCAKTTLQILTPVTLKGKGAIRNRTVPLFFGDSEFFGDGHLQYAIPAVFCLLIVLIPPPCILLLEPVLTKLFSLQFCRAPMKAAYSKLRLTFMPFLDSFQGSFKDNYRFFAGLYFAYRLFIPIMYLFSPTVANYYISAEILLFIIIFLHVSFRPYKVLWHSLLETIILLDLLLVNTITIFNYAANIWGNIDSRKETETLVWIQVIAVTFPLVYLIVYASISVYRNTKIFYNKQHSTATTSRISHVPSDTLESFGFPARMLESNTDYYTF